MGLIMRVQELSLVLKVCAFAACYLVIQGSAAPLVVEGTIGLLSNTHVFINLAPTAVPEPNGTVLQSPLIMPPLFSAPGPQTPEGGMPFPPPTTPPPAPQNPLIPPPTTPEHSVPAIPPIPLPAKPRPSDHPPLLPPAPLTSPPNKNDVHSPTPDSHQSKAPENSLVPQIAPVSNVPPRTMPETPRPSPSVLPEEPPSPPPDVSTPPPLSGNSPPVKPVSPVEPPSRSPAQNASPILAPPPIMSGERAAVPYPAPKTANAHVPVSRPPSKDPSPSKQRGNSSSAPSPQPVSNSTRVAYSPNEQHHASTYEISPAPLSSSVPPASSKQAPDTKPDPKTNLRHNAPPPISADNHRSYTPVPSPSPAPPPGKTKIPFVSPKSSPSGSLPHPKVPRLPPLHALPPPPPQKECAPLTCAEPLTYGPPEFPCVCVLPIQVGLRLNVAVYTFFPLVSELAADIAAGVFVKQSQVRIMGANASGDNPDKTIVLIDLVPIGQTFDETTAHFIFQRFWQKQLLIRTSEFGDYDVLYVRYPGLPPSPPLPPETVGIIGSKPYPARDNNGRTMQPLGVDVRGKQHKDGHKGSIVAIIALSALVAIILTSAVVWLLLFRHRDCLNRPGPTPATTVHSLAKSSGTAISRAGDGPGSPSFSLGSSMAAYTGSAKTFSSSDIEKATDFFNETRVLGEGGFGRVYGGVLEDGTKVAVKILKRYDQQGGREFLAEVEMLSRLHHRNLVKLIGICIEDRTRCLVYELIPNGSVDSHLHGIDRDVAPLDWSARLKIALGAARALSYLHEDSSPGVIHRDFKASNILLEDDFTPKVSDFGLARTALDEQNKHISTRVMGTFGYVAPEYAMTGHLLVKSDVYSYGVVLLELLTGKKPVDMSQPPGQENLVSWARPLLTTTDGLKSIMDPSLGPDFPFDSIAKVAAVASMCVQPEVSDRPFMGEVVQALKLISNECDKMNHLLSRSSTHDDLSLDMDDRSSPNWDPMLIQSPMSNYDYRLDVDSDVSMSELLSSAAKFEGQDSESFRRYSSSGPIRTGKAKRVWKTMRRLSGGSVSEHGVPFRLWPGSH